MWIFLHSGRALRFDEGQLAVVGDSPLLKSRPMAAVYAAGKVWVGTKTELVLLSHDLHIERTLSVKGPVLVLEDVPLMGLIAAGSLDGGALLELGEDLQTRRRDTWPDGEPPTAVCPADRITDRSDSLLWGTADGRLYLCYDVNHHPIDERMTGLISPHDGAIEALAQTIDGRIYCATQGGGFWVYDSQGMQKRLAKLDGAVVRLLAVEESVLIFTREGRVIAVTEEKPATIAKFDRELSCAAKVGDNVFIGTRDGHIACLFEPDILVPVADEPIACIC